MPAATDAALECTALFGSPVPTTAIGSPLLAKGQQVGNWTLDRELHCGQLTTVWLVTCDGLTAVCKIPVWRKAEDESLARKAIDREIEILRLLNGQNKVTSLRDTPCIGDVRVLIEDYVPGKPLKDMLKNGNRLPWQLAVRLCAEIAALLSNLHRIGVIHWDIKPGNVLVTPENHAVLVDYGVSHAPGIEDLTDDGMICCTPRYAAPQQFQGAPPSEADDVWSLGALLYVSLEGHGPFPGDTLVDIALGVINDEPQPLTEPVPDEVINLVGRCLQKPTTNRPSADEVEQTLLSALAHAA